MLVCSALMYQITRVWYWFNHEKIFPYFILSYIKLSKSKVQLRTSIWDAWLWMCVDSIHIACRVHTTITHLFDSINDRHLMCMNMVIILQTIHLLGLGVGSISSTFSWDTLFWRITSSNLLNICIVCIFWIADAFYLFIN